MGAGAGAGAGVASWPMRTATLRHCQRSEDGTTWYSSDIFVANEVVERECFKSIDIVVFLHLAFISTMEIFSPNVCFC